jgi:tRNA U34 5-methylaminomethyl-2-thiouridine-forming methyltransferase MnmC
MKDSIQNQFYSPLTPDEGVISLIRLWFKEEKKGDFNARKLAADELKNYLIKTADGTYTLYSKKINNSSETMHTIHGAYLEAQEKFVNPASLKGKKNVSILDVCSGLGFNSAAALEKIMDPEINPEIERIEIDLVEISLETLAASLLIPSPSGSHGLIKKAIENYLIINEYIKYPLEDRKIPKCIDLRVHCQDAREMVLEVLHGKKYDAIFLDPFSPDKSPELYSYDFLLKLGSLLKEDGLILTYTAAAPVRYALIDGGFHVGEGPLMGRSGGTIASKDVNKIVQPLSGNDERMVALSDAGIPFRDHELKDSGEKISKRREKERITVRNKLKMASTVKSPIYLTKNMDDERTKRRVLNHLRKLGINHLDSIKARFLVCPQFSQCICHCEELRPSNSRERVKEMEKRLNIITSSNISADCFLYIVQDEKN